MRKEYPNIKLWKGTQCRTVSIPKVLNLWKIFNFAYLKCNVLSLWNLLWLYFSAFHGRNRIRLKRKWAIKWVLFQHRFYHDIKIILKSWSGQVRWLRGDVKINFTSQIVRGVENTGMPTLGYFALLSNFPLLLSIFLLTLSFKQIEAPETLLQKGSVVNVHVILFLSKYFTKIMCLTLVNVTYGTLCPANFTNLMIISMGESNTIVSAYTMHRHLQ